MGPQEVSVLLCLCVLTSGVSGDREFFIAAVEDEWDYMPRGDLTGLKHLKAATGSVFKKVMYKQFTDATFRTEIPKPKWLGFLGPVIYGEEGEFIRVVFFNNASRVYSVHPHGVLYNKINEGAIYADGHHGNMSRHTGDIVEPGCNFTYVWKVTHESSPSEGDPDCLTWLYHSHVDTVKDTNSGLVGFLLTCKNVSLIGFNLKRHYSLFVSKVDESKSWYWEFNKKHFPPSESDKFPSINGYLFGNIPDLNACQGETITWHMAGLGTYSDAHSLSISGHSFESFHRRKHSISLSPAQFETATTTANKPGRWLISCNVFEHAENGLLAFLHVRTCSQLVYKPMPIRDIRWHYIAAEEVFWNYGPTGKNGLNGESLTTPGSNSETYFKKDSSSIGGTYKKAVFKAYNDYHFTSYKNQRGRPEHHGILGPVIRAEAGDLIEIVFKNMANRSYSLHAEGVAFSKKSEGAFYNDASNEQADNQVAPGESYTYYWYIPDNMAPTENDPQCLTNMYFSGVDPMKDANSGLVGPLLVCKPGTLNKDGKQKNISREIILMMSAFDENQSWYLNDNIRLAGLDSDVTRLKAFQKANLRHGINGLMYSNVRGLEMCAGDAVSVHVMSIGATDDMHSMYLHGNTFSSIHTRHSSIGLIPGDRKTLNMVVENPGVWELNCQTFSHQDVGETALYKVVKCPAVRATTRKFRQGVKRTFFIQAEEVKWDYAPSGRDLIYDTELPEDYQNSKLAKVLYRGYTDDSFKIRINSSGEEYLGILGPTIRVEVGDTLKIVFRNKGPQPFSIHPQGLVYQMGGRTKHKRRRPDQPIVHPGKTYTYIWKIRGSHGPGKQDPNCISSPYYSDVNLMRDINTGLIGAIVVCREGTLDTEGRRADVQKDFAIYYSQVVETKSWLREKNFRKCFEGSDKLRSRCPPGSVLAINGYAYGNQPLPTMPQYSIVDWYLMTMGDENDLHPVHFHGNDIYLYDGKTHTNDVTVLFPGVFTTVTMHAVNSGMWLYHCHVNSHIQGGMEGMYLVLNTTQPPEI